MSVSHIHTFLVHPGKRTTKESLIVGTTVPLSGGMFELLAGIYAKSEHECDVDITFKASEDGKQQNDCRDLIIKYLKKPGLTKGKQIAERLAAHTDRRSGLGLLFLIAGRTESAHKIVLSRFPTDSAIYVDENPKSFTVQLLERVFMKNKTSYKAVLYRHDSFHSGFWSGRAIDRQVNNQSEIPSNYWISDFLLSDLQTTSAAGTRRLAVALKEAAKGAPLAIKQEIVAATTLANGLVGQRISILKFLDHFNLSLPARDLVLRQLKSPKLATEMFVLDAGVYKGLVPFRSVELSNGATLTADTEKFDDVFQQEPATEGGDVIKFVTKGKVIDEKLKNAK